MIAFWNWFVKITAWPFQKLIFRTRVIAEDPAVQGRRIHGPAIIVSNHTAVYDFAVLLFTFFTRTLRVQMAEVLFRKPVLGVFLRMLGGIRVDRDAHDLTGLNRSAAVLDKGGVVGVFPEGRLPLPDEERPLPFREGAAELALSSGVPVIPVHISGRYFSRGRMCIVIGKPVDLREVCGGIADEREARRAGSGYLRGRVMELGAIASREA